MNPRAQIRLLSDGRPWHLNDGPIDLVLEAFGAPSETQEAYRVASARFGTILDELCGELSYLRQATSTDASWPHGKVARRMVAAVMPYAGEHFITPMAAVAGAVADEILSAMICAADLAKAYVNDGGDIALHLAPGEKFIIGMVERPDRPSLLGTATIHSSVAPRGIATSGWRGRSFSLGIADAVTVLSDRASAADAAATIIANAVDLPGHPAVVRVPACELAPDSDLGERLVTQGVGDLSAWESDMALAFGVRTAQTLLRMGLIRGAALSLRGQTRVVGEVGAQLVSVRSEGRLVHA